MKSAVVAIPSAAEKEVLVIENLQVHSEEWEKGSTGIGRHVVAAATAEVHTLRSLLR